MCFVNRKSSCWPNKIIQRTRCFFLLTAQTVNIISQLPLPPLHNHSETHQGQVAEDSVITALLKKRSNSQVLFNRTMKDQESIISSCICVGRDCMTFTSHDLADFYIESVTVHRIKINDHSCFYNRWPNSKTKLNYIKTFLRARGPPGVLRALRSLRILRIGRIGAAVTVFFLSSIIGVNRPYLWSYFTVLHKQHVKKKKKKKEM